MQRTSTQGRYASPQTLLRHGGSSSKHRCRLHLSIGGSGWEQGPEEPFLAVSKGRAAGVTASQAVWASTVLCWSATAAQSWQRSCSIGRLQLCIAQEAGVCVQLARVDVPCQRTFKAVMQQAGSLAVQSTCPINSCLCYSACRCCSIALRVENAVHAFFLCTCAKQLLSSVSH
jgi:hypothetical protein